MQFYPLNTPVPAEKRSNRLWLRPLRATDVELDYDAVMSSREQLRRWSQTTWPADEFTLAENLEDLEGHEQEHHEHVAFTFTVLNPAGTHCLGCVYITPLGDYAEALYANATYAARVGFWVRTSELANNLDEHLLALLRGWFAAEWPFDLVTFVVSQQNTQQITLFTEACLKQQLAFEFRAGRPCWLYA